MPLIQAENNGLNAWLAYVLAKNEMYDEALKHYEIANSKGAIGWTNGLAGNNDEANSILEDYKSLFESGANVAGSIAWIYLGLGKNDQAIEWFENGLEGSIKSGTFGRYKMGLNMWDETKVLHRYPRFQALLEKVNSTKL